MKTIYNIFSKEKIIKENNVKLRIKVDYREKNSLVCSELIALGFEIEFENLKVGDYLIENIVIERKTISDFISSMINKRLSKQLEEMQQYEKKLLIIEGFEEKFLYTNNEEGVNSNAIRGFLLSILLKKNIPIAYTQNENDTAKFMKVLALKKEKSEVSLRAVKKSLNKKEQIQFILEGFPGIGPVTSKKLIEKSHSIKNVINADEKDLKEILGKKSDVFKNIIE